MTKLGLLGQGGDAPGLRGMPFGDSTTAFETTERCADPATVTGFSGGASGRIDGQAHAARIVSTVLRQSKKASTSSRAARRWRS
jgi:hypothetical protein